MPKQTYQPNKRRRSKKHGFLHRMANSAGKRVLKRRSFKGRQKLSQ